MSDNPYQPPSQPSEGLSVLRPLPANSEFALAAGHLAVGAASGFMIWASTAPKEAWDVNRYYSVCVFVAGLVSSFARLRGFVFAVLGVYLGQVIAIMLLIPMKGVPVMLSFISVLFFGTLPAVVGAALGAAIGWCIMSTVRQVGRFN